MSSNKLKEINKNRSIKMPTINTSFGFKRNPLQDDSHVEELTDELHDHVYEFSMMTLESYEKAKCGTEFTAYLYPFCKDIERYINLKRINLQLPVIDYHTECTCGDEDESNIDCKLLWDHFYECCDRVTNGVLENDEFISMAEWKPYVIMQLISLEEIYQDNYKVNQMIRLLEEYRKYAKGNKEKTDVIERGYQIKSYDEYFNIRILSSGIRAIFTMVEYADNLYMADEEWQDPLMQKYIDLASILVALINDIFSFEKEFNESNSKSKLMFNAVALKMAWDSLTAEEAISSLVELFYDYEKKTKVVIEQLKDKYKSRKDVQQFVESISYAIGGGVEGHYLLHRYNES